MTNLIPTATLKSFLIFHRFPCKGKLIRFSEIFSVARDSLLRFRKNESNIRSVKLTLPIQFLSKAAEKTNLLKLKVYTHQKLFFETKLKCWKWLENLSDLRGLVPRSQICMHMHAYSPLNHGYLKRFLLISDYCVVAICIFNLGTQ